MKRDRVVERFCDEPIVVARDADAPEGERTAMPSAEEVMLAQLGQTIVATRAQAIATAEQCDAALVVVRLMQARAEERAALEQGAPPTRPESKTPAMFGANPARSA